jgi:hypothetical protein
VRYGCRSLWREGGLSFTIDAGPRQRSHPRVRVPWDSRPYFTVSDSRFPFSSPPTTRRVTVEVFEPASTRDSPATKLVLLINPRHGPHRRHRPSAAVLFVSVAAGNVFTEPLPRNICYICLSRGCCIATALHATTFSTRCHTTHSYQLPALLNSGIQTYRRTKIKLLMSDNKECDNVTPYSAVGTDMYCLHFQICSDWNLYPAGRLDLSSMWNEVVVAYVITWRDWRESWRISVWIACVPAVTARIKAWSITAELTSSINGFRMIIWITSYHLSKQN